MRFNNNDQEANEKREFVKKSLQDRIQGDMQQLFDNLDDFMHSESVMALMVNYKQLQEDIYQAWLSKGYGQKQADFEIDMTAPTPIVPDLETEPSGLEQSEEPLVEESKEESGTTEENPDENQEEPQELPESSEPDDAQEEKPLSDMPEQKSNPTIPVKLVLPNGKTGQEYEQKVDLSPFKRALDTLRSIEATGFEAAGLSFDEETFRIGGSPDQPGSFLVSILLEFDATAELPPQAFRLQGNIEILPDPKKLWKELEPDANLPYPKPHTHAESLALGGRTMIAASRRGRSHAHSGTFRDDDFSLAVEEQEGWQILAVADGAGSAAYSRQGSQIACSQATSTLLQKLDHTFSMDLDALGREWKAAQTESLRHQIKSKIYDCLSQAAFSAYKAIGLEAESIQEPIKAFHTTLLLAIVKQFDFGYFVGTYWVGDGGIGVYQRGKYLKLMGAPDSGEFAGQTRFLTMPEIWTDGSTIMKRMEFDIVEDFTGILLMTDGVTDPKMQTDHNLGQLAKWDTLWDDLSETVDFGPDSLSPEQELLEWLDFWSPGEHDDRTIAILY